MSDLTSYALSVSSVTDAIGCSGLVGVSRPSLPMAATLDGLVVVRPAPTDQARQHLSLDLGYALRHEPGGGGESGATAAAATQAGQRRWEQWPDACPEGTVHFPGGEYAWRPPGEVACGTGFGQGQRPGTLPPTQAVDGECRSVPSSPQVPPIPLNSFAMTA